MNREIFIDTIANIVRDCSFDGCNVDSAEVKAETLYDQIQSNTTPPVLDGEAMKELQKSLSNRFWKMPYEENYRKVLINIDSIMDKKFKEISKSMNAVEPVDEEELKGFNLDMVAMLVSNVPKEVGLNNKRVADFITEKVRRLVVSMVNNKGGSNG